MAKISFLAFLAIGAASRSEGTAYLQTGGVEKRLADVGASRESRLLGMKQNVLAFADSGVPDAAKPLLEGIISTLEEEILNEIGGERTAEETVHNNLFNAFSVATEGYNTAIGNLDDPTPEMDAHSACRTQESVYYQESVVCNAAEAAAQTVLENDQRDARALGDDYDACGQGLSTASAPDLQAYVAKFTAAIASRGALESKRADCQVWTADLSTQKALCDDKQADYEIAACSQAVGTKNAVDQYETSYAAAKAGFEDEFSTWEAQDDDRVHQCKLVHTLICYVHALKEHDDKDPLQAAVDSCDAASDSHDCSAVSFTHSNTPAAIAVAAEPPAPCQAGFSYGGFPDGTEPADCTTCTGIAGGGGGAGVRLQFDERSECVPAEDCGSCSYDLDENNDGSVNFGNFRNCPNWAMFYSQRKIEWTDLPIGLQFKCDVLDNVHFGFLEYRENRNWQEHIYQGSHFPINLECGANTGLRTNLQIRNMGEVSWTTPYIDMGADNINLYIDATGEPTLRINGELRSTGTRLRQNRFPMDLMITPHSSGGTDAGMIRNILWTGGFEG